MVLSKQINKESLFIIQPMKVYAMHSKKFFFLIFDCQVANSA